MQTDQTDYRKYVFVCGLPRSGTSLLGRNIARLEDCTGFKNTGVLEDEGRFLQDVYPTEGDCGGPGRFGFDPRIHLTEASGLLTPANAAKLRASWHAYWDNSKAIFVEKTPANLVMTRFLQAAFPNSYFVVIKRHPIPVSMAPQKWKVNVTSLYNMFEHWLHCHELFEQDKKYLTHLYELRYEDYVENASRYHEEIAAFIGTRVPNPPSEDTFYRVAQWRNPGGLRVPDRTVEETSSAHNQKYFDRWRNLLTKPPFNGYYRYIATKYEPRFAAYGYSLMRDCCLDEGVLEASGKLLNTVGPLFCIAADAGALLMRSAVRGRSRLKRQIKAALPEFVVAQIRENRKRRTESFGTVRLCTNGTDTGKPVDILSSRRVRGKH